MAVASPMTASHPLPDDGSEQAPQAEEQVANGRTDVYEITIPQAQELVARLTAVRGALQDHLEDNPVIYSGVAALLDFTAQICRKLKSTVLGAGSGALQVLLVQEVGQRIHEVDIAKHFTAPSFEAKIKQMNGYQSHIVSPEKAVTALISDAFSDCAPIAQWMVVAVRAFLSKAARDCASEVVERDPDHRQQLADLIVAGMEEVFNEWEMEAAALAEEIMAMEKTIVSPVFFQRLALKRRQRELLGGFNEEQLTGVRGAAERVRASGAGLLARLRGQKADGGSGRKAPNSSAGGEDDSDQPRSSGPSFANRRRTAPSASSIANFTPGPARNLRFVKHIKAWEPVTRVILKDTVSQFELMRGKFFKKAHATGIQAAVTKSWSARFFIFDCQNCDLFYWKDEPTAEFIQTNAEQEHLKATRVSMPKARMEEPTKEEMKGFSGSEACGVRISNAYVKNRFDVVILGFANDGEKAMFINTVSQSLQPAEPEPKEEVVEEEEEEEAAAAPEPGEDDEEADAYGGYKEDGEQGGGAGGEGGEGEEGEEDDGMPDSPTHSYRPGGLGVGSHFFNADDLKDKVGNKILTGEIMIPSRWRVKSRSADEPDTGGITHRIEGTEALLWLTSDMNMYVTIVKDTMAATLPKMAVSVLLQRIIANDMLRRLQKMAMGWQHAVPDDKTGDGARTLHSTDATTNALKDLEEAMTEVRMATTNATLSSTRENKKPSEVRCVVPIQALALAGHGRLLAAAQQPSAETILQDQYGPLFPFKALEFSDVAAKRWQAAEDYDRTKPTINVAADPLAPPAGSMTAAEAAQREQDAETDALRGGTRSGMAAGVTSSVVDFASRMKDGMTGRRRVTDQDVEDERRNITSQPQPLSAPMRAPPRRGAGSPATSTPSTVTVSAADDGLSAPSAAPVQPVSNDPLGGGGGLGPALGFGSDPLSAPRVAAQPAQSNGRRPADEYDDDDEDSMPLQRAAQNAAGGPQRAPPRAPPARPAASRRAPPGPAGGGPPRVAPPTPGIGRPAPMRSAPGRPAPAAPGRPAPMRPAPARENLPL